jgi:addiction module HigA family antidote
MTQTELAQQLGLPQETMNAIIEAQIAIVPEIATKLQKVFQRPAYFWINLQNHYEQTLIRLGQRKSNLDWLQKFPLPFMIKQGWITKYKDKTEQLQEIFRFFAIDSVEQWSDKWKSYQVAYRKSQKSDACFYAISAWLCYGETEAQRTECEFFNEQNFLAVLDEIRPLTQELPEVFIPHLQKLCASAGVAVIFTPEPPKTAISGATHWVDGEKAIIQLSLRYKSNDHLWFTFFHEAGHVIKHGRGAIFVEETQAQQDNSEITEKEANQFARDQLIPLSEYQKFLLPWSVRRDYPLKDRLNLITEFAEKIGIAPGVVVGRLQFDKKFPFSSGNELKVSYYLNNMKN